MTADDAAPLGGLVQEFAPKGGFTGWQNRAPVRTALLTFTGLIVGLIPGLFVALFTDLWVALVIGAVIGGIGGFLWARRLNFDAAVTEARLHEGGVVLVDARGTHSLPWAEVAGIAGRHLTAVLQTGKFGIGDIEGVTEHSYLLRARDGTGFWLDDRISNVVTLVAAIAQRSGVPIQPLR